MLFSFLFILSLTGVVVYASTMVWKTDYSQKEKRVLIGILFGLLSLVIIVNEAKDQNYISFSLLGLHETDCSQNFFTISELQSSLLQPRFSLLPMSYSHSSEIIKHNFGNIDQMPEQIANSFFYLSISEENSGASYVLKHYAQYLQQNNIPALYVRLTKTVKSQQDLENALQIQGLEKISKTVGKMNTKKNLIPFIIIDNYQFAFNEGKDRESFSLLTNMLVDIYYQYQVKIILHTHIKKVATHIMQVPRIYQVLDLVRYQSISPVFAIEYIKEHYSETTKGIKVEQLQHIDDFIGLDYEIISKFTSTYEKLQGEETKFVEQILQEYQLSVNRDQELKDILYITKEALGLKDKVKSSNRIINLSELKRKGLQNLSESLQKYEQAGIMWIEQGNVSFQKAYFNSLFV